MADKFCADVAPNARAKCHHSKCKKKFKAGDVRVGKTIPDTFARTHNCDMDAMRTIFYHVNCYVEMTKTMRKGTARIKSLEDISGLATLSDADRKTLVDTLQVPETSQS